MWAIKCFHECVWLCWCSYYLWQLRVECKIRKLAHYKNILPFHYSKRRCSWFRLSAKPPRWLPSETSSKYFVHGGFERLCLSFRNFNTICFIYLQNLKIDKITVQIFTLYLKIKFKLKYLYLFKYSHFISNQIIFEIVSLINLY